MSPLEQRPTPLAASKYDQGRPLVAPLDLFYLAYLYPLRLTARLLPARLFLTLTRPLVTAWTSCRPGAVSRVERRMKRAFPDWPEQRLQHCARRQVGKFVSRALEDLVLDRLIEAGLRDAEVEGLHFLDDALEAGRGALVFSVHLYAMRLARRHLATLGYQLVGMRQGRPPGNRSVGRLGRRYLQPVYTQLLHQAIGQEILLGQSDSSLAMLRHLRANRILYSHLDAVYAHERRYAPILNGSRYFPAGPLDLARLTGCALLPMRCEGDASRLRIQFYAPQDLEPDSDRNAFFERNLPRLVAKVEGFLREAPEEWEGWDDHPWHEHRGADVIRTDRATGRSPGSRRRSLGK